LGEEVLRLAKTSDILSSLDKNPNTVVICNSRKHERMVIDLHKAVAKKFRKICMITIHEPFPILIKTLQEEKIDSSRYCFIDCISAEHSVVKDSKQCMYVSSPAALTELAIAIEKTRKKHNMDLIIFDSISALLVFNAETAVLRFLNFMVSRVRKTDTKAIYSILQETRKEFLADLTLFADAVIEI
jgi:KaiC/GvpD/RAD55 family RecA-like ATPase